MFLGWLLADLALLVSMFLLIVLVLIAILHCLGGVIT